MCLCYFYLIFAGGGFPFFFSRRCHEGFSLGGPGPPCRRSVPGYLCYTPGAGLAVTLAWKFRTIVWGKLGWFVWPVWVHTKYEVGRRAYITYTCNR